MSGGFSSFPFSHFSSLNILPDDSSSRSFSMWKMRNADEKKRENVSWGLRKRSSITVLFTIEGIHKTTGETLFVSYAKYCYSKNFSRSSFLCYAFQFSLLFRCTSTLIIRKWSHEAKLIVNLLSAYGMTLVRSLAVSALVLSIPYPFRNDIVMQNSANSCKPCEATCAYVSFPGKETLICFCRGWFHVHIFSGLKHLL